MKYIERRIAALEGGQTLNGLPMVIRIIGRTEDQARADYELKHGLINPAWNIIFRRIVDPS